MAKKKNILGGLLDGSVSVPKDTEGELQQLKNDRNSKIKPDGGKPGEPTPTTQKPQAPKKGAPALGKKAFDHFENLLSGEDYTDKKDQFMFSFSGNLNNDFEKLALIYSYKTGNKTSRNDILRKILEDFHKKNISQLLEFIDKL